VIARDRHTSLSVEWKHLCPYTEHDPNDPDVEANWVVFWKGDRYHPDTGEIYASGDAVGDWFNISCAREAGVEMLRTGTGEAVAPYTSRAKRQAVLNMFMAKYCPTPERFTELGKWLYWDGTKAKRLPSMLNNIGTISSFEGIWNEDGVVCLDKHRDDSKVLTCRPPPCAGMVDDWQAHGILQSWIPKTLTAQLSPP
jgi:hypothetical protein